MMWENGTVTHGFSFLFLIEDSNSPLQTDPSYPELALRPEPGEEGADAKAGTPTVGRRAGCCHGASEELDPGLREQSSLKALPEAFFYVKALGKV